MKKPQPHNKKAEDIHDSIMSEPEPAQRPEAQNYFHNAHRKKYNQTTTSSVKMILYTRLS